MAALVAPDIRFESSYRAAMAEFVAEGRAEELRSLREHATFASFVQELHAHTEGRELPRGWVAGTTFWLVDGELFIGTVEVRHRLNDELRRRGGHVGYSIRPTMRRLGYGTLALSQALPRCLDLGIDRILVTCDESNAASRRIIEANGGVLEDSVQLPDRTVATMRYWIDAREQCLDPAEVATADAYSLTRTPPTGPSLRVGAVGETDDELAQHVAAMAWSRTEKLSAAHVGIDRLTWRVGRDLWLTGIDEDRAGILQRENALLRWLRSTGTSSDLRFEVPEVVPSRDGEDVVARGGRVFRATANIDGVRPDDDQRQTFVESMRALREVHALLRDTPADLAVLDPVPAQLRQLVTQCLSEQWTRVTNDPTEPTLVCRVAEWLAPRITRLDEAPQQLIHGDWTTPNLLVGATGTSNVVAVLDWRLCAVGPVIVDLGQAVSGVLMWSGLAIEPTVDRIFDEYGPDADRRLLGTAMAAYWFRNYWWVREELGRDERHRASMDRQPGRLRSVMAFVEGLD
jgi:predicted acetyltransferase/aminoglycoside phosphotransferase (APT) family kinase protein